MSWTFAEERPIYWEEQPEQIAITNVETGEWDAYMLTSAAMRMIRDAKDDANWLNAELHGAEMEAKKATELKAENVRLRSCLEDAAENERLTTHEFNQLKEQRDKLRELVMGLKYCAHEAYGMCARVTVGGERPFTCCPLYDFDAKKYQCEKLMLELGIEVK